MDLQQYAHAIAKLSPSRRAVYNALVSLGPVADEDLVEAMGGSRSKLIPRRGDLVKQGLVRAVGTRATDSGGSTTVWGLVPPAEVEQAREAKEQAGPRRLQINKWDFEDKVRVARALLRDPKVNLALQEQSKPGARRARARAHQEIERAKRERQDEIRRAEAEHSELVALLKARHHLHLYVEAVREVGFFLEAEMDREDGDRPTLIPDGAWEQVLDLLDEGTRVSQNIQERIARHIGQDVRPSVQIIESSTDAFDAARPIKVIDTSAADRVAATDGNEQPRT